MHGAADIRTVSSSHTWHDENRKRKSDDVYRRRTGEGSRELLLSARKLGHWLFPPRPEKGHLFTVSSRLQKYVVLPSARCGVRSRGSASSTDAPHGKALVLSCQFLYSASGAFELPGSRKSKLYHTNSFNMQR